ncbi:MAG TPA: imidazole glycerol phosphate synthase cyclase subunit [Chitinophagaceae bacterium]
MENVRIIARLDIKGPNLVKGIHLEGLRVLGKPEDFARYYYENGADELFYQDVVASLYDRNSLQEMITKTAEQIFIPLTVGGGIRTLDDIKNVLRAGADKVAINTAAIRNPSFIKEASKKFGSSTIVVAIEAIKQPGGEYYAFIDNGREYTGVEVVKWAQQVAESGAGEIVITSVDREGTGNGYDLELTKKVALGVPIPVIAHGGAGSLTDLSDVVEEGKADAVALASMIHYDFVTKHKADFTNKTEGNTNFLESGRSFSRIALHNVAEIKDFFSTRGIPCRSIELV